MKKYHLEFKEISKIFNNESYVCGECEECNESYKEVLKVFKNVLEKQK